MHIYEDFRLAILIS